MLIRATRREFDAKTKPRMGTKNVTLMTNPTINPLLQTPIHFPFSCRIGPKERLVMCHYMERNYLIRPRELAINMKWIEWIRQKRKKKSLDTTCSPSSPSIRWALSPSGLHQMSSIGKWQMTRAYRYILQAKMRTLMINARVISIMQYLIAQLSAYLNLLRQ